MRAHNPKKPCSWLPSRCVESSGRYLSVTCRRRRSIAAIDVYAFFHFPCIRSFVALKYKSLRSVGVDDRPGRDLL